MCLGKSGRHKTSREARYIRHATEFEPQSEFEAQSEYGRTRVNSRTSGQSGEIDQSLETEGTYNQLLERSFSVQQQSIYSQLQLYANVNDYTARNQDFVELMQ